MQGLPPNNELESSFNMGFSSILTVLQNMENGQNTIIDLLNKTIDMFDNIADNIGTTFNTSIGKLGIGGLTNYNKMIYNTNIKSFKILTNINKLLNNFTKNVKSIDNSENIDFSNQQVKGKNNNIFNAKEIFNLNITDADDKKIKLATGMIKEINNFFKNKKEYKIVEQFFINIRKEFYLINNVIFKVGKGFAFLTASLIALTVVNYAAIVKIATILPAVGLGLFLFIIMLKKAFSTKKGGNFLTGMKEMFSMWSLMKSLPDLLIALGKGALFLSMSLILFNAIGYDAILKMSVSLMALGLTVKKMVDSQGLGLGMTVNLFLVANLIVITTLALYATSEVKWDSVFKLPMFMLTLGLGLRIAGFDKIGNLKLMNVLAISLLIITVSLVQFENIKWETTIKLSLFIAGLGLALKTISKDISIMSLVAIGMMLLSASMIDFQELNILSIIQIIGVVGLIGVVVNKFVLGASGIGSKISNWTDIGEAGGGTGFGLFGFAFGLILLSGALYLLSGISWKTLGQAIVFIAALGLVFKLFFSTKTTSFLGVSGKKAVQVPSMLGFGLGMAVLVLALDAISDINWDDAFELLLFMVGLAAILKWMGPNTKVSGMLGFSIGISLLLFALDAMSEIEWESVFKMVIFIAGIGFAMWLMKGTGTLQMLAMAFSIGALATVLFLVGKLFTPTMWENVFGFVLTSAALGYLIFLLGKIPLNKIGGGVLVAAGIGVVTWLMAKALQEVSKIEFSLEGTLTFLGGVVVMALVVTVLGALVLNPLGAAIATGGVLALGGIAAATWLMAKALQEVSSVKYDVIAIEQFGMGITSLMKTYGDLDPILLIASTISAVLVMAIAGISWLIMPILESLSRAKYSWSAINNFGKAVGTLVKSFNDNVSVWASGKASAKAIAMRPLIWLAFSMISLMNRINKLTLVPLKMEIFNLMVKSFINSTIGTLKDSSKDIKDALPGIAAVGELMNIGTQLAKTVGDIANLKFYEFEVKDGKLVLSNVRQLNDKDFKMVGVSIGKLIKALINPLSVLGDNSDSFMIGSESIPNPFKSNKMVKGMEMVKKISEVFKPLIDTIKSYSNLKISFDKTAAYNYVHSLNVIIGSYMGVLISLNKMDTTNTDNGLTFIKSFNELMEEVDISKFKTLDGKFGDFINKLNDSSKWKKIHENTAILAKNLHSTAKAINSIDIKKAAALENNVKLFVQNNNAEKIKEIVESFKELFSNIHDQRMAEVGAYNNNFTLPIPANNNNQTTIPLSGGDNTYLSTPGVQEINNSKTVNNDNSQNNEAPQMNGSDLTNYKLDKLTNAINNLVLKMK